MMTLLLAALAFVTRVLVFVVFVATMVVLVAVVKDTFGRGGYGVEQEF